MSQTPTYEPYAPGRPGPEDAPREHRSGGPDCLVVASVVCVVIWAMSGFGYFWPIWVLLPTILPRVLGSRSWSRSSSRSWRGVGPSCRPKN